MEVISEKKNFVNEEDKWSDLGKIQSWSKALLRANMPSSFDEEDLLNIIKTVYPEDKYPTLLVAAEPAGDSNDNNDISNSNSNGSTNDDNTLFSPLEEVDWVSKVQESWPPQLIGDLLVRFPWHDKPNTELELEGTPRYELVLEGGAAFGTGDHPTTRLCCRWLQRKLHTYSDGSSSGSDSSGSSNKKHVMDYGCGSGILGLAALRFGAKLAVGIDIDSASLLSAQQNCLTNGLEMDLYIGNSHKQ